MSFPCCTQAGKQPQKGLGCLQETKVSTQSCKGLDLRAHPCPSATRVTAEMCRQGSNGEHLSCSLVCWSLPAVLTHVGMWAAGQSSCVGEAGGGASNNVFRARRSKLFRACPAQLWESLFPYWEIDGSGRILLRLHWSRHTDLRTLCFVTLMNETNFVD